MTISYLTPSIVIVMGACIMALNIKKSNDLKCRIKEIFGELYLSIKGPFIFNQSLIALFFIGYIIVLITINSAKLVVGNFFISLIFLFGAVFVFLEIYLQRKMVRSMESLYQDILRANEELAQKKEELTAINKTLTQKIKSQQQTKLNLSKSYDTQTVINKILKKALTESTVTDVVDYCLDLILSIPWLSFESQGSISLVESTKGALNLKSHRGLYDEVVERCRVVPYGKCLCGLAAQSQKVIYAGHVDERHDIIQPEIEDHGHYCIPIISKNKTLGVINIHLRVGHEKNEFEINFLNSVANTMAIVLMQKEEEKRNEDMMLKSLQAQKMESMGTLAGGIAHDFNNILSGVFGYINLAEMNINDAEKAKKQIHQVLAGARRAADLVQQILTFSRQSENLKRPLKAYLIVKEAIQFLRSSIPATIKIKSEIQSKSMILADPTHLHQIVMNLCTNAYHAMQKEGGTISIRLDEVTVSDFKTIPDTKIPGGNYIRFEVNDTGCGIPQDLMEKIFEPYFTTKKMGEGTGLGLAMVASIVEDHGGHIKVYSEINKGSTFHVYFPLFQGKQSYEEKRIQKHDEIKSGSEHIMVVDDDDSIRDSIKEILKDYGYRVTSYSDGKKALTEFKEDSSQFDLVVTDLTMPQLTGDKLIEGIFEIKPDFPIIVCSGYNRDQTMSNAPNLPFDRLVNYFQKPLDISKLLRQIRTVFDGPRIQSKHRDESSVSKDR